MFKIHLDLSGLEGLKDMQGRAEQAVKEAVRDLTAMGHAKAMELASQRLKTRRQMFVEGLSMTQVDDSTWVIVLDASAVWIDEGAPPRDMLKDLLNSPKAITKEDGSKYLQVPFRHGPAQESTPVQQDLVDTLKSEMRKRKIPWAKVERDDQGRPMYGRLHSFSVEGAPIKTGNGPGQGWGPVGKVRQGPNERQRAGGGPGGGGNPFLSGVSVYQREGAGGKVQRDVMTFRTASSSQAGTGMWQHPGSKPGLIFKDTHEWLVQQWEQSVGPAIVDKLRG